MNNKLREYLVQFIFVFSYGLISIIIATLLFENASLLVTILFLLLAFFFLSLIYVYRSVIFNNNIEKNIEYAIYAIKNINKEEKLIYNPDREFF